MSSFEGANPQTPAVRCVLLHAASGELPGELLGSLAKRVQRTIVCTNPYKALAEACLIEQERHDRGNGLGTPESDKPSGVLLLVNPRSIARVAEVLEAAKVYAPSLARWFYDRSANPKLRAIVDSDVTAWTQAQSPVRPRAPGAPGATLPSVPVGSRGILQAPRAAQSSAQPRFVPPLRPAPAAATAPRAERQPRLRLTGRSPEELGAGAGPATAPRQPRSAPILTEEELRMLLSDEPLDSSDAPPPGANGHQ